MFIKFIYSEKATKFCAVHTVKSKGKISENFVAFSEYMNFNFFSFREPLARIILFICVIIKCVPKKSRLG